MLDCRVLGYPTTEFVIFNETSNGTRPFIRKLLSEHCIRLGLSGIVFINTCFTDH